MCRLVERDEQTTPFHRYQVVVFVPAADVFTVATGSAGAKVRMLWDAMISLGLRNR